jgi:subtilisin-like proprotein convertase family protein
MPDSYASEIGVKLTEPSGTQTVWAHGTFDSCGWENNYIGCKEQLASYTTAGDYTLQIYDSWGDGCSGSSSQPISCTLSASYGSDWTESTTTISKGIQKIETVEVTVDITHTYLGDLDIVLVSPSGTESWLARLHVDGTNDISWTFTTVHNWDEYSDGTWTLKVRDMAAGDSGTLNSWSLNIYGTNCPSGSYQISGSAGCTSASAGYYATGTASSVSAGNYHTCAVLSDGSVYCSGYNYYGQLGDGNSGHGFDSSTPVAVSLPSGRTASSVSAGDWHTCAVLDDGSAYCWGRNSVGQLGDGTTTTSSTPVAVSLPSGRTATSVSAGGYHTCAVLDDGSAYCWGDNSDGQLGDGTTTDSSTPVAVSLPSGLTATSVDLGEYHTCAVLDDASAYCWGWNFYGQLGDGTTTDSSTPVAVSLPSGRTATSVDAGKYHTCAVLDDASAYCWGFNY